MTHALRADAAMTPYLLDTGRVRLQSLTPGAKPAGHPLHDRAPYALAFCAAGSSVPLGTVGLEPCGEGFAPTLTLAAGTTDPAAVEAAAAEAAAQFARWMPQRFGILRLDVPVGTPSDKPDCTPSDALSSLWRRAGYAPSPAGLSADCRFRAPVQETLTDGVVTLARRRLDPPDTERGWTAAAFFDILAGGVTAGSCSLRIGYNEALFWNGHVSYTVFPAHRGHGYAARAARLLAGFARACGMPQVSVCCVPTNLASRRTAENAGFDLEGRYPIPVWHPVYEKGRREAVLRFVYDCAPAISS